MGKIKVAFIKFAGMASGGTEKYLQTIACILDKDKYEVDFYYTNAAPYIGSSFVHPDNDEERKKLVESCGVKTIKINVKNRMGNHPPYDWVNHDFWEKFDEDKYDIIQTARGGYTEFPFNQIHNTPIIDSIHSYVGEDKPNIKKAILLCEWQRNRWASSGGNLNKSEIIPSIVYVPKKNDYNLKKELNIEGKFIYGFHQGNSYSNVSLDSYSKIEDDTNHFLVLGGSDQHRQQAVNLGLKNITFLPHNSSVEYIHSFLNTLDVFAHSRSDGEVCSASIIESMYHGLPIISCPGSNMGHVEQIKGCGRMCNSINEYIEEMKLLKNDKEYYDGKSKKTLDRYYEKYDYKMVEDKIRKIYNDII